MLRKSMSKRKFWIWSSVTWGGVRAEVGQVLNWAGSKVGLGLGLRLGPGLGWAAL